MQDTIRIIGEIEATVNRVSDDSVVDGRHKFNKLLTAGIDQLVKLFICENPNKFEYIAVGKVGDPADVIDVGELTLKSEVKRKQGTIEKVFVNGNAIGYTIKAKFTFADLGNTATTIKEIGACTSNGVFLDRIIIPGLDLLDDQHNLNISITFTIVGN